MRPKKKITKKCTNAALFNIAGSLSLNTLTLSSSPSLNVPHMTAVALVTVDDCPVREQGMCDFRFSMTTKAFHETILHRTSHEASEVYLSISVPRLHFFLVVK